MPPKAAPNRLHSSTVQHRGATLRPSSTRGAPHDDHIFPRGRDRLRIHAADGLRVRADTGPGHTSTGRENGAGEKKAEKPRTAASLECSKEADTKGVHGKERKKFMSECKKTAKDAAAKPKT